MPQYLRSIRQSRWSRPTWAGAQQQDAQADALRDLATYGNLLSMYQVKSCQDINRVTAALAATRDNLQNVDYAVFDDAEFQNIGVQIRQSDGNTPMPKSTCCITILGS